MCARTKRHADYCLADDKHRNPRAGPHAFRHLSAASRRPPGLRPVTLRGQQHARRSRHLLAHRHWALDHCARHDTAARRLLLFDARRRVDFARMAGRDSERLALRSFRMGRPGGNHRFLRCRRIGDAAARAAAQPRAGACVAGDAAGGGAGDAAPAGATAHLYAADPRLVGRRPRCRPQRRPRTVAVARCR